MTRSTATLALIALLGSGLAAAQTPPPPPEQPAPSTMGPSPGSSTAPSSSQSAPNSDATTDKKAQLKDCITQQRTNDPQMSEHDAKKICKAAVNGAPQS